MCLCVRYCFGCLPRVACLTCQAPINRRRVGRTNYHLACVRSAVQQQIEQLRVRIPSAVLIYLVVAAQRSTRTGFQARVQLDSTASQSS